METSAESFAELLARARSGDAAALGQLARQYEAEVRTVARLRLGPALRPYLDSIDLVQSVHRSLLVGLRNDKFEFHKPEDLIALALTIVRRKAARHWRQMRRQERESGVRSADSGISETLAGLASPDADPAAAAAYRDTLDAVCRQLDASERQLLELHLEGYRTVEVAKLLNQNSDVLRVKMSRLRARIRAAGLNLDDI